MTTNISIVTASDIQTLTAHLPKLSISSQNFAISLINAFKKYKKLTPNQAPYVHKMIAQAITPKPVVPTLTLLGSFAGVLDLFKVAKASKLKFPKISLLCADQKISLSLAGEKSKNPGYVNITGEGQYPFRKWFGRVSPAGVWEPATSMTPEFKEEMAVLLSALALHPAAVAKAYGKLTGNCCFCRKGLTDPRSVAAGFGPICAEHYGLKAQWEVAATVGTVTPADAGVGLFGDMEAPSPVQSSAVEEFFSGLPGQDVGQEVVDYIPVCYLCGKQPTAVTKNGYDLCASCAAAV